MGRVLLKIVAGVAAAIVLFWLLSVVIGLLAWVVMIGVVVGVVYLAVRMVREVPGTRR